MSDTSVQAGRPLWLKILVAIGVGVGAAVGMWFVGVGGVPLILPFVVVAVVAVVIHHVVRRPTALPVPSPAHVGYTTDGQPIYPVVGYTADGVAVTADRAQGVIARAGQTNSLAIAALIAAFVFAPAGIIMGHIARGQIRRTGDAGDGMALAALIIGYIWLALVVVAVAAVAVLVAA